MGLIGNKEIEKLMKNDEIIVYSVLPIENGSLVSPSRVYMEDFGTNLYSKKVSPHDIVWNHPYSGQLCILE